MADIKQLKIKIQSTKNIKKITNAMEIISTIKLQKIKKKAEYLREYMITFLGMIASIDSYKALFPKPKQTNNPRELAIVISSEKWLCGSLNTILFKQFHSQYATQSDTLDVYTLGKKARDYMQRRGYTIVWSSSLPDTVAPSDLQDLYTIIDTARKSGTYTTITVRYNYFKNTMKQIPVAFQLFPLSVEKFMEFVQTLEIALPQSSSTRRHMKVEPNKKIIVKKAYDIMMNVVVYGAVLHNKTGEFASRMLAMKGAKDNATTIIGDLTLSYNKARQDAITKEVLEIVSAKAVIEN